MAVFDFESICSRDEEFKDTEITIWIGKIRYSISILSIALEDPIFLCETKPCDLVSSFNDAPENLAAQSEVQLKMKFRKLKQQYKVYLHRSSIFSIQVTVIEMIPKRTASRGTHDAAATNFTL